MPALQYYTSDAVLELRRKVGDRVEWYFDSSASHIDFAAKTPHRSTRVETRAWAHNLVVNEQASAQSDAANAVTVYSALSELTPHQASEDRLWTYLCHHEGRAYVAQRWLRGYQPNSDHVVERIINHFFVRGNRSLIRDNGLSRLWWLGWIAHRIDPEEPRRFLDILLYRQDVRSALIERPSVSMNDTVLRAVYAVMREDFGTTEKALFQRNTFREWMKNVNRRGGIILLDAVPASELDGLIRREAERALDAIA